MELPFLSVLGVIGGAVILDVLRNNWDHARHKRPNSRYPWPLMSRWHTVRTLQVYLPVSVIWYAHVPGWGWKLAVVLGAVLLRRAAENYD